MKLMMIALVSVVGFQAHASLDDAKDLANKIKVSDHCASQILAQATKQCNVESKAKEGSDREHGCFYSYDMTGFSMEHPNEGKFEIVFTTGDSDEWSYLISIIDEADQNDCTFNIQPNNDGK